MARKRDYYEVLGVSRDADEAAVKKLTERLQKSIIRIPILTMSRLLKNSKKQPRHIRY